MSNVYIITGGTSGLGRYLAENIPKRNDHVLIIAREFRKFETLKIILDEKGVNSKFLSVDFSRIADFEELIENTVNEYESIDVLVNNIGGSLKLDSKCSSNEFLSLLSLNLVGTHVLTKSVIPGMIRKGQGKIISISSMASFNFDGLTPYVVAKSALDAYVRKIAMELSGTGVSHIGIRPGPINVPNRYLTELEESNPEEFKNWSKAHNFTPGRLCTMSEIGELVQFLVGNSGRFLNGSFINLGGGMF